MNEIHIYVKMPEYEPNYSTLTEALSSVDAFQIPSYTKTDSGMADSQKGESNAPAKSFPAQESSLPPVIIHIGEGIFREELVITRPHVTLLGAGQDKTIIVYNRAASDIMPEGDKRGTFRTASVRIDTHDFTAKHISFQNDAGFGHTVGQALALYVDGDRNYFEDCIFLGSQDTLFTAPLPMKEAQPGGFRGPGEFKPRTMGRHFYKNCFIRGDVDFIFGSAIAYFEDCTIFSQLPGDRKPPESPDDEVIYGYVTAASTPQEEPYGYVFKDCKLISDCPPHSVYLGRPWREWAKTVFLNCELGEHIHPLGWNDWKKTHGHFYYGEYNSYGPGASPQTRADFSHQLTEEEAKEYTIENVLKGWNPLIG